MQAQKPEQLVDPESLKRRSPPWRLLIIATIVLASAATFGVRLWLHASRFADTDNAVVSGHVQPVSTRIAGVVVEIAVQDNQPVKTGDVLLRLDPADVQVQMERLKAQLTQAEAAIVGSAAQIEQARAAALAATAQVEQSQATLTRTEQDVARNQLLFAGELRAISKQEVDASFAARGVALADLGARRASAKAAEQGVRAMIAAQASTVAQKAVLDAQLKEVELQAGYTAVLSPGSGRIGKRTVELGQRVQPGQQLAAVVDGAVWIVANFKETQLESMRVGQSATVELDAFPGRALKARVDSFAPASGATFALLPPDNATGNFTKIVQRVPVKLVLDPSQMNDIADRVVPGMSASVSVDLRP